MIVGIDYGATIDRYPEMFRDLIKHFYEWGHTVYIVPGRNYKYFQDASDVLSAVRETYYKDLFGFGIKREWYKEILPHDDRKHTNDDKYKGKQCLAYKIDLFFDNDDSYIEDIKRHSPETKVIKVKY